MALEHIFNRPIEGPEGIVIPVGAKYYDIRSRKIRFFRGDGGRNKKAIPEGSKLISFPKYERHAFNIYYGEPVFYDEINEGVRIDG